MSNPVCISPLKFYDSLAKQSHHKSYAYGHISPLITKTGWVPPFQFVIPTQLYADSTGIFSVHICDAKTNQELQEIIPSLQSLKTVNGYYVDASGDKQAFSGMSYIIYDISNFSNIDVLIQYLDSEGVSVWCTYSDLVSGDVSSSKTVRNYISRGSDRRIPYHTSMEKLQNEKYIAICNNASYWSRGYRVSIDYIVRSIDDYKVFMHTGKQPIPISISEGLYYIKITSDNGGILTYYSEVFCFDNVTKDCLELEYWNETGNFVVKNGVIAFPSDFHFKLLLKGEIGKPEYNFEEESTKRLGYIFVESQVSKKTYKFNTIVPEYICDALRLVRLCDNKIIRCKDDEYEAITFEMEAEWQTQGDLASVTCEFETDNVVANIGGFVPDKLGGDYNNDYNEDFDKE